MASAADLSSMEPLFPEPAPLKEPALAVVREAGALGGQLHPVTRSSVAELLRAINTYHSNLIEGHDTRPGDIERALAGSLSTSPERRALQMEARAHVEVQRLVEKRLETDPSLVLTGPRVLRADACRVEGGAGRRRNEGASCGSRTAARRGSRGRPAPSPSRADAARPSRTL